MSPLYALIICFIFSLYLLYLDIKNKPNVSFAIWIPLIWLLIISSRMVNLWFAPETGAAGQIDVNQISEGNLVDRNIFLILMVIGFLILLKRKISWSGILKNNIWIFLLFAYYALSIIWSDFPYVSFKRYIKAIGCLVMAMIVITEVNPLEAFKTMVRRCSYILIPLSIILIKYFPVYGRYYNRWSGELSITGVTTNKNSLGALCLVCGIVIFSDLLAYLRKQYDYADKKIVLFQLIIFIMLIWLLISCKSATSLMCFIIGIFIFLMTGVPLIKNNTKAIGYYLFAFIILFIIMEFAFNITSIILAGLGRDATLTGRTDLWNDALAMKTNPFIGVGFEAFWLGDRLAFFWDKHWMHPTEIHNGYLETYLSFGIIGVFILITVVISGYKKITNKFVSNFKHARLFFTYYVIILIFNITESAFQPMHLIGFIFLLTVIDYNFSNTTIGKTPEI
jgi:exopolysaccharide production protein ExoQ